MAIVEGVFGADSRAVARLLGLLQSRELQMDRVTLAVATVDSLLAGLGLSELERLQWYGSQSNAWDEVGQEYRERKALLRSILADSGVPGGVPGGVRAQPGGAQAAAILARRNSELELLAHRLQALAGSDGLGQTLATLYSSLVHLHLNRLAGMELTSERRVLGLLLRTREGLDRTPRR
jgi:lantibiotic biosynthesis protein